MTETVQPLAMTKASPEALEMLKGGGALQPLKKEEGGASAPYIGFYDHRANNALDVRAALGEDVAAGTPYIGGMDAYGENPVIGIPEDARLYFVANTEAWADYDFEERKYQAALDSDPFSTTGELREKINAYERGERKGAKAFQHTVRTIALVVLPDGRVIPTNSLFRTTKANVVAKPLQALSKVMADPGKWAGDNAVRLDVMKAAPENPNYWLATKIRVKGQQKGKSGFKYVPADGVTEVSSINLLKALASWVNAGAPGLEDAKAAYDRDVESLQKALDNTEL